MGLAIFHVARGQLRQRRRQQIAVAIETVYMDMVIFDNYTRLIIGKSRPYASAEFE